MGECHFQDMMIWQKPFIKYTGVLRIFHPIPATSTWPRNFRANIYNKSIIIKYLKLIRTIKIILIYKAIYIYIYHYIPIIISFPNIFPDHTTSAVRHFPAQVGIPSLRHSTAEQMAGPGWDGCDDPKNWHLKVLKGGNWWYTMMNHDEPWSTMMNHDQLWWTMMNHDEP